jgi:DHA1 family bicyclomycin/chloramphenicol resistance-like MFS transporter
VLSRTVVRDLFETKDAARMYSFLMLVMGLAPITAPFLGGQMLLYFDWRAIFWFLTCFGMLCFVLVAFGLPESLPTDRRQHLSLRSVLGNYGNLMRDKAFMGFAIVNGCITGGMFAYISGSPFVFIDLHGVAPEHFGWIFGANAAGLIATSQFNRRLLRSYDSRTILRGMLFTYMASSVVLVVAAASQWGGMWSLMLPLFICVSCNGMSGPNATAAALEPYGRIAGIASALFGTTQFLIGASAGALVAMLDNGTAVPMAAVMCFCGVIALAAFFLLANRKGTVQQASRTAA